MRPIRLTMTAFGSYADTTEIPFSDLKNGLFLVTGDIFTHSSSFYCCQKER